MYKFLIMRYTSFYTIKELDYKAIEASLSKENIPIELRNTLQTLIDDHKAIIECRKKIVEQQNVHANALFQLFDESSEENNENINNTPLNNEENNNSQNSNNVEVENNSQNSPENEEEESKNSSEPKSKNRKNGGKKKLPTGKIINHSLTKEEKKCSGCGSKMHKQRSKTKTYVLALPFLSTETHTLESCRCLS